MPHAHVAQVCSYRDQALPQRASPVVARPWRALWAPWRPSESRNNYRSRGSVKDCARQEPLLLPCQQNDKIVSNIKHLPGAKYFSGVTVLTGVRPVALFRACAPVAPLQGARKGPAKARASPGLGRVVPQG